MAASIMALAAALVFFLSAATALYIFILLLFKVSSNELYHYASDVDAPIRGDNASIKHPEAVKGLAVDSEGNLKPKSSYSAMTTARLFE